MNANLLRGKIKEKGYTQTQCAELVGMSANSLSRKLNGEREFTVEEAVRLCRVLEITDPASIFFSDSVPNMQQSTV